jgi:glutamate carboxypeptidase
MANKERLALDWLASDRASMIALLEQLVNTDSNSHDKAGVDAVGGHIRNFLSQLSIPCAATPIDRFGDVIIASRVA